MMLSGPLSYGGEKKFDANCLIMTVKKSYWVFIQAAV